MKLGIFIRGEFASLLFIVWCVRADVCCVQHHNWIGDDGAKSIAAAVKGNSSLQIV
jgi:hypothetical protein